MRRSGGGHAYHLRTIGVVNKVCLTLTLMVPSQWRDLIG